MAFFVYILQSESTAEIYTGQTADLARRVAQHNDPGCRLTLHTKRRRGRWKLVYWEEYGTRAEAMRRERELKTGKGREWIKRKVRGTGEGEGGV